MSKKVKTFTTERYREHLMSRGVDGSQIVEDKTKAWEMAEAGDWSRTRAKLLQQVGRKLIRGSESSKIGHTNGKNYVTDEDLARRQNSYMLGAAAFEAVKENTALDVARALKGGPVPYDMQMSAAEIAVVQDKYSPIEVKNSTTMQRLYEMNEGYRRGSGWASLTFADVASSVIVPRDGAKLREFTEDGLTEDDMANRLDEHPNWDYHFPVHDHELEKAVDLLANQRQAELADADFYEETAGYDYDESRRKKTRPSRADKLMKRFD